MPKRGVPDDSHETGTQKKSKTKGDAPKLARGQTSDGEEYWEVSYDAPVEDMQYSLLNTFVACLPVVQLPPSRFF
jgi:hypothetical protein